MKTQDNRSKAAASPSSDSTSAPQAGAVQVGHDLRRKAEALARERTARTPDDSATLSPDEIRDALHELRVHQIELEMQNEELHRAQAEIEAGRARYFELYNLAPVGYCTVSEQGLILEANLTAATLLGTARSDLVKRPFSQFIVKEDQDLYYLQRKQLFETGTAQEYELLLVKPDGSHFWAHLTATAAQAEDGAPLCRVVLSDITVRKQMEEDLRRSERLFRLDFEESPVGRCLVGLDGRIGKANHAFCGLLGRSAPELGGLGFMDLTHPEDLEASAEGVRQLLEGTLDRLDLEKRYITPELQTVWASVRVGLIRDEAGVPLHFSFYVQDITERKRAESALRESEERFAQIAEQSRIITWQVDADGLYTYVSHAVTPVLGYKPEDLIGKMHFYDLHPATGRDAFRAAALAAFARKESFRDYENQAETMAGCPVWFSTNGIPVLDENGNLAGYRGNDRDITERKLAEQSLRESEAFQNLLMDTIPAPVFYKDRQGRYLGFNKDFETLFGQTKDQLVGKSVLNIAPPELAKIYHAKDIELFERPGTQVYETSVQNAQGNLRDVIFHKASIIDAQGTVAGLIGIIIDVTERKRAEEALRQSEERNRLLSDLTMEGILLHRDAVAIDLNLALARMMGLEREELLGKNFMEFVHVDDRALVLENISKEHAPPYTVRVVRNTGESFFAEIESRYIRQQGDLLRVSAIRDLTERKQAEAEQEKLQTQFLQAQKMQSVGLLAGGVAHDFNNMLGIILGHTELAMARIEPGGSLHADLAQIRMAAQRSADLTRQILAFARKQTIAPKVLDLNHTVEGMLKMLRRLIGEEIDLDWKPGPGLCPVKMDPTQIDQILANLCINARDAISGVGKITVSTRNTALDGESCARLGGGTPGEYVMLSVSDDGCGMDSETLLLVFDPFYTTKEVGKGTGLGLATVYGIVKQNQGFINASSEPGQGATFTIHLPRHAAEMEPDAGKAPDQAVSSGHETILLVEDEPALLKMATIVLESQGYTVLVAGSPAEAIRLACEHDGRIDLLLTDVVMPGMNGRDLAKSLASACPGLKRLFMSGYTADIIARHGVMDEGAHFIQKPFSLKDLAAKLREALEE